MSSNNFALDGRKRSVYFALLMLDQFLGFQRNLLLVIGMLVLFVPLVLIAVTNPEPLFGLRVPIYWAVVRTLVYLAWSLTFGGFLALNNQPKVTHKIPPYDVGGVTTSNDTYVGNSGIFTAVMMLLGVVAALGFGVNVFFVAVFTIFQVICLVVPGFHEWGRFVGTFIATGVIFLLTVWICIVGAGV